MRGSGRKLTTSRDRKGAVPPLAKYRSLTVAARLSLGLLALSALAVSAAAQTTSPATTQPGQALVTLDFPAEGVEIRTLADIVSRRLGIPILYDETINNKR